MTSAGLKPTHIVSSKAMPDLIPSPTVPDSVRQCLEESNGIVTDATERLVGRVKSDNNLFQALMWPLIENACYDAVRSVCRLQRRKVWETARYTEDNILAVASTRLMDMVLPGGLTLGEAHRKDLLNAAEFYGRQAENMAHKERFLGAIAAKLNGKRVNRALKEEDLCELQADTK